MSNYQKTESRAEQSRADQTKGMPTCLAEVFAHPVLLFFTGLNVTDRAYDHQGTGVTERFCLLAYDLYGLCL